MTESVSESSATILSNSTMKKSMKILHVDDDPSFLKVAKQSLEMQGIFAVDSASSVNEALEKLEKTDYDAVVSDYQMPSKDGLEFLKELREKGNTVPFIVFTGKGREDVAMKALNLGADQYVDKHGDPETVYCELAHAIRKATDRKSKEIELFKKEAKLQAVLDSSPDAITVSDLNGNVIQCNEATLDMLGFSSKDELIGKNGYELIAKKDRQKATENLKKTLDQGSVKNIEYAFSTRDGHEFPTELSASVLRDSSGKVVGFVSVARNISERKKKEEALKESEERYRTLFQTTREGIIVRGPDDKIFSANPAAAALLGYERPEELVGKSTSEFYADKNQRKAVLEDLIKKGHVEDLEVAVKKKDGTNICASFSIASHSDKSGNILQTGIFRDITERKKMEEEIKSLARFPSENPNPVLRVSQRGIVLYANNPGKALLQNWEREVVAPTPELLRKVVAETFSNQSGKSFDLNLGEQVYSIAVTPVMGSGYANIYGIDITERKKAEETLGKEQQELDCIINSSPIIVFHKDKEGKILRTNRAFAEALQMSQEDFVGKTVFDLYSAEIAQSMTNDDLEVLESGCPKLGIIEQYESASGLRWVQTDKVPIFSENGIPNGIIGFAQDITERRQAEEEVKSSEQKFRGLVEDSAAAIATIDLKGRLTFVNKALADLFGYSVQEMSGRAFKDFLYPGDRGGLVRLFLKIIVLRRQPRKFEFRALRKDGAVLHLMCKPSRLERAGKPVGFQAILIDNTAEKRMLEKVEKMYEKLSVVGGLTRHDVNNKLSTILNVSYLLKQRLRDNQSLELVKETESAVHQIEGLFEFARIYEKLGTEELTWVDAEKVFKEAAMLFPSLQDRRIVNECHGLIVFADSLLRQLFYNLIDNSLKHSEKLGQVRVHYETNEDHLKLIYEDDGIGVPKAEKDKIFKEGYGKTSGHGLHLIKKMCEVYGWTIQETGKQGKGAQFTIIISRTNQNGKENYRLH